MPKPTFFQSVLRKPTRSYADPDAPSPWADHPVGPASEEGEEQEDYRSPSRYQSREHDDVRGGLSRDGSEEAGPSWPRRAKGTVSAIGDRQSAGDAEASQPRKPKPTVSVGNDLQTTMGTRFPKPVKKVASSIGLRDGAVVRIVDERDSSASTGPRRKKKAQARSDVASSVASVRPTSPAPPNTSFTPRRKVKSRLLDTETSSPVTMSSPSPVNAKIPTFQTQPRPARSESSSCTISSADPPTAPTARPPVPEVLSKSRTAVTAVQKPFAAPFVAPLTPPSSDMSSAHSSAASRDRVISFTPSTPVLPEPAEIERPARAPVVILPTEDATDDEGAGFHTPRTSLDFSDTTIKDTDTVERDLVTVRPLAPAMPILSFHVQPPTPASIALPSSSSVQYSSPASAPSDTRSSQVPTSRSFPSLGSPLSWGPIKVRSRTTAPPSSLATSPPSFNFLPPTPAPLPDPETSPFHSESTASASLSSLHPDRPPQSRMLPAMGVPYPSTTVQTPTQTTRHKAMTSPPPSVPQQDASPIVNHSDAESASGEVGSDADEESERVGESAVSRGRHTRQSSYSRPPSRPHSRAATSRDRSRPRSVVKSSISASADGHRSVSRQSTVRNRPFDDFVVRRRDSMAESEALFDPRPVREGSIRSSTSGYGKGGWAAAAASRSGASSPVMYMPTTGNEGWAHFQAPPRESRFTPLPPASQPMTFDRLLNSGYQGGLAPPVTHNGHREPTGSSPSEYSQSSDEDELLPKPSRSYAKKDYGSDRSRSPSASQDQSQDSTPSAELRQSQEYVGTLSNPSPIDPCAEARRSTTPSLADNHWPRTDVLLPSRPPSVIPRPPRSPSRPMSPGSMHSRPMSPIMPDDMASRPSSRIGFDTPSFLNPDTLTLLPEMSLEDSARTYRPTQSETGRSRQSGRPDAMPKRSHSMFGGSARSLNSEGDHDEDDEMPELTPRRAKSAQGRRNGGLSAKWEGSSYGEGQLMESNGRVSESTGGYTNMILPSGAYKALNPAKSASEINTRVLGLPHSTMAAITLSTSAHRLSATPMHLRHQLHPPVDFSSHLKPPTKLSNSQVLIQIYAVAIDDVDLNALGSKGKGDVGKWVPGRSFVGRCLSVGVEEKEIVRGDIVLGLVDVRKSGILAEYILCDRRRLARAPYPTTLTLEQMALLPLQGIAAARAIRTHLVRHSRAVIMDAHTGVAALVCQAMSRAGVNITAVIGGGDDHHEAQTACMAHGASGVLTGSPAAVMLGLDEGGWDYIFDTQGRQRAYDAAKRILKDGGKLVSIVPPEASMSANGQVHSRPSGIRNLRAAFSSRRKESKYIAFEYLSPTGSGEPGVDASGVDCRDALEEPCISTFKPVVKNIWPLEKGMEAFRGRMGVSVIRLVN